MTSAHDDRQEREVQAHDPAADPAAEAATEPTPADAERARRQRWTVALVTTLLVGAYLAVLVPWLAQRHQEGWSGLLFHGPQQEEQEELSELPVTSWFLGEPGEVRNVLPRSPAARAGIEKGDTVVAVGGVPLDDADGLAALADRLHRGDSVTYELADGRRAEVRLVSPLALSGIAFAMAVSALVGFAFLAISLLVTRAKPGSRQALVFYLCCTSLAALFFALSITELQAQGSRGIEPLEVQGLTNLPFFAVYVFLGVVSANLLLHMVLIFPRTRPVIAARPRLLVWLHTVPFLPFVAVFCFFAAGAFSGDSAVVRWSLVTAAGTGLVAALWRLRGAARRDGRRTAVLERPFLVQGAVLAALVVAGSLLTELPRPSLIAVSVLSFLGLFFWYLVAGPLLFAVLTVMSLLRSYREGGVEEKRQLRWPLWGTSVALVGSMFFGGLLILLAKVAPEITAQTWCSGSLMAVAKGLYVLIPLSFAFAIVKYRLMDIDLLLRKTVVYAAMSAFVVLVFLLLVGGLGVALVAWTGVQNQVVTVVATLLLVAVFVPVRNRVQSLVDRRYGGAPSRDEALAELRRAVLAASDLEDLLPRLAETTQQALGSRAVVVFVRPVHGGALEARAKVGVPDEVVGRLRLDAAPLAAAGRVVECAETPLDDDDRQALRRLRLAWLAPARRGGEVVAAVATGRHLDGSDPEPDELEFLASAADQLTLAVGTLGPRREAVELDQARELQRSLLPGDLPRLPGADLAALWQPAREVAGDYYDALDFGAEGVALCIGDVAGKGMPAALLMASLQAAVRAVARPDADPARVCEQVRRVVCQSLAGGRFVTFFYGFLRPTEGGLRLTYTNAGHVPPLLHRAGTGANGGGRVERLEAGGGVFVRLLADTPLISSTVDLAPGDRLLLLTDGVSEAQSADGRMFGEERLEALLLAAADPTAAGLAQRVAAEVGRHAAGDAADDITLLALRVS